MNQPKLKLGPFSLLLTVITACLVILALLSFSSARADHRKAERFADTVRIRYALEMEGQQYIADLSEAFLQGKGEEALSEAVKTEEGLYEKDFESDGYILKILIQETENDVEIHSWSVTRRFEETQEPVHLWQGKE